MQCGFVYLGFFFCGVIWAETLPEQPDWSQARALVVPPETSQDSSAASSGDQSETSSFSEVPDPVGLEHALSTSDLPNEQSYASTEGSEVPATDHASEIGVPQSSNFFLPSFRDYGLPFFERQGLRFRIGPTHLRMMLELDSEYNDNIYGTFKDTKPDVITTIAPRFYMEIGDFKSQIEDYLILEYRPAFQYFATYPELNGFIQTLNLNAKATFSRYSTTIGLSYIDDDEPNATQSGRQDYQLLNFNWDNSYFVGTKTFLRATLGVAYQHYENGDHYTTYTLSPFIGYEYSPKTNLYIGPSIGITYIGNDHLPFFNGTQTFQGLNVGFAYTNQRKLKIEGLLGVQAYQFQGFNASGASNFLTPTFDFSLTYAAREKTDLKLELIRNVQISDVLLGLTYTTNQMLLSFNHHFDSHFSAKLTLEYQYLEYQGLAPQGRIDQYVACTPSISYNFCQEQCSLTLYYNRRQRSSSIEVFGYTINAYGIRLEYRF